MKDKQILSAYERLESHWHILNRIHEMIRFSEVKAGMVITLFSIMLTLIFSSQSLIQEKIGQSTLLLVLVCLLGASIAISFFYSVRAFFPRFMDKNPKSVIYFGDIRREFPDYKNYSAYLSEQCDDSRKMEIQISEQIHTLSAIADSKFSNVKLAVRYLIIALTILFIGASLSFTIQ